MDDLPKDRSKLSKAQRASFILATSKEQLTLPCGERFSLRYHTAGHHHEAVNVFNNPKSQIIERLLLLLTLPLPLAATLSDLKWPVTICFTLPDQTIHQSVKKSPKKIFTIWDNWELATGSSNALTFIPQNHLRLAHGWDQNLPCCTFGYASHLWHKCHWRGNG